jgi:hypothetical protein
VRYHLTDLDSFQRDAVLPQFGHVAFAMGGMLPAAVFIILVARTPRLVPKWLSGIGYPVAVLVALTALLFMPVFLFLAWVFAVGATHARQKAALDPISTP